MIQVRVPKAVGGRIHRHAPVSVRPPRLHSAAHELVKQLNGVIGTASHCAGSALVVVIHRGAGNDPRRRPILFLLHFTLCPRTAELARGLYALSSVHQDPDHSCFYGELL